jgi:hypothetical protein
MLHDGHPGRASIILSHSAGIRAGMPRATLWTLAPRHGAVGSLDRWIYDPGIFRDIGSLQASALAYSRPSSTDIATSESTSEFWLTIKEFLTSTAVFSTMRS